MRSFLIRTNISRTQNGVLIKYRSFQSSSDAYTQLIESYARDRALQSGRVLHAHLIISGLARLTHFASKLIAFYTGCRRLFDARKLFDKIPKQISAVGSQIEKARRVFDGMVEKDLVALNAMVAGYVQHEFVKTALGLVVKMRLIGVKPNVVTWNTLIAGFSQAGDEVMVSEIVKLMRIDGVEPDVVSWTSVISGYVQNFHGDEAFRTFKEMLDHGLYPSSATISSLLPACASVAELKHGKEVHGYAMAIGVEEDIFVRSALIDMYAKCGYLYEAKTLFQKMSEKNTVTWNSMIFGYANHGYCNEAIELFNQMVTKEEKKLDHLTFTAALTACSHAGKIELGQNLFHLMQENYGIKPRLEHYACMVDLLGKANKLVEAYDLIQAMPMEPDLFVWGALLGACRHHGNIDLAEIATRQLSKLEPESAGSSLLMSSLYADAGSWRNVVRVKNMMKKRRLRKFPGCSWIETP
ncbi:unnamed protein product [Ilex paraguariensis]|uniref:Pentatricopeptide repeat-containing protein n=1 Tax=Ilex paraguariensis TaxID=185542 RepID=A0ABC8SLN6_9AQUA